MNTVFSILKIDNVFMKLSRCFYVPIVDNANFTGKKNKGRIRINCKKGLIEFNCEYFL